MKPIEPDQAGEAIRRLVVGAAYETEVKTKGSEIRNLFANAGTVHMWGAFWTRPDLDLPSRSALTMALLLVQGRGGQEGLSVHFRGALRNGWYTREQIIEILMHCAVYAGYPKAKAALKVALKVFEEEDAHAAQK